MSYTVYWDAPEPIRKEFDEFLLALWREEKPYWGKQEIAWRSFWFGRQSIIRGSAVAPPQARPADEPLNWAHESRRAEGMVEEILSGKFPAVEGAGAPQAPDLAATQAALESAQFKLDQWELLCAPVLEFAQKNSDALGIHLGESIFAHILTMLKEKAAGGASGSTPGAGDLTAAAEIGLNVLRLIANEQPKRTTVWAAIDQLEKAIRSCAAPTQAGPQSQGVPDGK